MSAAETILSPEAVTGAHGSSLQRVVRRMGMASGNGKQEIHTPDDLAELVVKHFLPCGKIVEPCKGDGAFVRAMPGCDWYEIAEGRDWLTADGKWDWCVTNPPWKHLGAFLDKAMQCSDNIVFLCWASAWWTKNRQRRISAEGFGMVEMLCVQTPRNKPWPDSGFILSATWLKRGWKGSTRIEYA